jgi:hypothetical protein
MITFFIILIPGLSYGRSNIVVDSDRVKLFKNFGQYFVSPQQAETLPGAGKGQIPEDAAVFSIVTINNINGNNPFNQYQPVLNFGGVLLSTVTDLINCIQGGVCRQTPAPTPPTPPGPVNPPITFGCVAGPAGEAGIKLNSGTQTYSLLNTAIGSTIIFNVTPSTKLEYYPLMTWNGPGEGGVNLPVGVPVGRTKTYTELATGITATVSFTVTLTVTGNPCSAVLNVTNVTWGGGVHP